MGFPVLVWFLCFFSLVGPDATADCSILMVFWAPSGSDVGCEVWISLVFIWGGMFSNWFPIGVGFLAGIVWFSWGLVTAGLVGLVNSMLLMVGWAPSLSTLGLGLFLAGLEFLFGVFRVLGLGFDPKLFGGGFVLFTTGAVLIWVWFSGFEDGFIRALCLMVSNLIWFSSLPRPWV